MSSTRVLCWSLVAASLAAAFPAQASRLKIVVSGADFRPFPVAAPDLVSGGGGLPKGTLGELSNVLQDGVALVRVLELVPPKSYLAPEKEPWAAPVYANWVNVGASGLIRGQVSGKGDAMQLQLRFFDVLAQRELLNKSYNASADTAADRIHQFLDEVVEVLTGEPGIFSSRITYVQKTKGGKAVFTCGIDGHKVRRITEPGELSLLPSWDRSGRYLLFTSYLKGNPDLYRFDLHGGQPEPLSDRRGLNTGGAVSPDGKKIALTLSVDGNTEIYVMDWNGQNLTRLTDSWGQDVSASWSPDGRRIAFVSSRSGQPHIYIMNADGSDQRRLTFQGNYNQEPSWSPRPDGPIAFTARDEQLMFDIFTVNPDSGEITRLTQDEGQKNESPSFSPDGQKIVFTSDRAPGHGKKMFVMDVDGRNQKRVGGDTGVEVETPRWGPRQGW